MAVKKTFNKPLVAKPREVEEDDVEDLGSDDSSPSILETGSVDGILSSDEEEGVDGEEDDQGNVQNQLSTISFGALAKAQDSLSRKRKRGSDTAPQQEDKLDALRARLQELKEVKAAKDGGRSKDSTKDKSRKEARKQEADSDDSSAEEEQDDDSDGSEDAQPTSRSSKHAPMSQSSKRQVTRKRSVVDAPTMKLRDPRFGPMSGPVDQTRLENAYGFLTDYRKSEMDDLRGAIRKSKNEDEKDTLRRKLNSMENQAKAKARKDREQEVVREQRKGQREAVAQGKQPYYLKGSEKRKLVQTKQFEGMKGKEREKVIEKRRKKASQKEMKSIPQARRIVG